jgi:secreted trypsin-like serine protease
MKKMSLVLAFSLVTLFGAAPAKAIVFGEDIKSASTDYPWVASIWYSGPNDDYYYPICSGSLITQDAVLTAAHCLNSKGTYLVQMGSNTLDEDNDDTFYEISRIWKHPRYDNETLLNDVGLLKLTTFQNEIKPMALATRGDLLAIRNIKKFEMFGWGNDQTGNYAQFLGYAKLKNLTKVAIDLFEADDFDPISTIAAGRYLKRLGVYAGSGEGDSGGPLVARINGGKKIVGITSWGANNDHFNSPTAFSNVAHQSTEIAKGLAILQRFAITESRQM